MTKLDSGVRSERAPAGARPRARRRASRSNGRRATVDQVGFELIQRERIMLAVAELVEQSGAGELTVAALTARARISRRTFYQHFEDKQQALAATVDESLARARAASLPAYRARQPDGWREAIRAGLAALLDFLDQNPSLGSLLIVGVHSAGPPMLRRRSDVIGSLVEAVDAGRALSRAPNSHPISAEAIVGSVLLILHERMLEQPRPAMSSLLGELMSVIVRPYLGASAAAREARLARPSPDAPARTRNRNGLPRRISVRLTMRTTKVLNTIAEHPGASNRQVAELAGIEDQGQASKLLARLAQAGLVENTNLTAEYGTPNSWRLAGEGERLVGTLSSCFAAGR